MSNWSPQQQQIVALASLCGVLVGALRASGALTPELAEQVFALTDQLLPDEAGPHGQEAIVVVRNAARAVQAD